MKAIRTLFQAIMVLALVGALFVTVPQVHATGTTITVNTTSNVQTDGHCSFQEAVQAANTNIAVDGYACPAGTAGAVDIIEFHIGGGGAATITLSNWVEITDPVSINGATQGDVSSGPLITITGNVLYLLWFKPGSDGSTVRSLALNSTGSNDITPRTSLLLYSSNNEVYGNYFNTNGSQSLGIYTYGIVVGDTSGNIIGGPADADRNIFGGKYGVIMTGGSNSLIQNNYFGVQASGNTALTDLPVPLIAGTSKAISVTRMAAGAGPHAIRGNVITGYSYGIRLDGTGGGGGTVHDITVAGNKIGVGEDGSTRLPNYQGVALYGTSNNILGGVTAADRNVISGNINAQIFVYKQEGFQTDNNIIQGNYIGTNASGTAAVTPAASYGISIWGGSGTLVGGTAAGSGNLISGNGDGIYLSSVSSGTIVRGNYIGTDADGDSAIPNSIGIDVYSSANIGDDIIPGNNLISGNSAAGISIGSNTAPTIYGNKIGLTAAGGALGNVQGVYIDSSSPWQIVRNRIANNTSFGVFITSDSGAQGSANGNCFANNAEGVHNSNTIDVDFANNWWSHAGGPSHTGYPGLGDWVSDDVTFTPFATVPAPACGPGVGLSTGEFHFPNQLVGTSSAPGLITVRNHGVTTVTIGHLDPLSAPFSLSGGDCPTPDVGWTLAAGASCTIGVVFSPTATGAALPQSLTITSDAASSPDVVAIVGAGTAGKQLLQNRSFEADVDANGRPDKFTYTNFNVNTDKRDCSVHKSGSCSLKLVGNGKTKTATQVIQKSGATGHDFTFWLWSKAQNVPAGAIYRLQVQFFNGAVQVGTTQIMDFNIGTHGFEKVNGTFTAPSSYTKIRFRIIFQASSGRAWFDVGALNRAP